MSSHAMVSHTPRVVTRPGLLLEAGKQLDKNLFSVPFPVLQISLSWPHKEEGDKVKGV